MYRALTAFIPVVGLLVVAFVGCASEEPAKNVTASEVRATDLSKAVKDQKGKVVLIDCWATWCVPCIAEIPALNQLQEKYGNKGVRIVGVALASGEADEVKPFVGKNKMKYTVVMGDDDQVYDLNVIAFPTTYLLTRDMKIFRKYIGSGAKKAAELEADIQALLAGKS